MEWLSKHEWPTEVHADERPFRLAVIATATLIATGILGFLLVGISVGSLKLYWFRLYLPFYTLGFAWVLWRGRHTIRPLPVATWLLVGFGIYMVVSALWAAGGVGDVVAGLATLGGALVTMAGVYWTSINRRVLLLYVGVLIALVAFAEVISLWEIITGNHLWLTRIVRRPEAANHPTGELGFPVATAWYYNRNNFGFFLAFLAAPLAALAHRSHRTLETRAVAALILVAALIIMKNNGSRAAIATAVLAIVAVEAFALLRPYLRERVPSSAGRRAAMAGIFGAAALVVIVLVILRNPFYHSRSLQLSLQITEASIPLLSGETGTSFAIRWQLAVQGLQMLVWSNGLGVGVGSFTPVYESMWGVSGSPHNWLTGLLAEFGVIGTSLFLAAYARILYDIAARYVATADWLCLGLFGALVTLPINALGPSDALYTQLGFWIVIGLAAAAAYRTGRSYHTLS